MSFQNSDEFIARKLEELLNLMIEVLPSCHFSAKRHRLDCLYFLVVHVTKVTTSISFPNLGESIYFGSEMLLNTNRLIKIKLFFSRQDPSELNRHEVIASFLTEIILALKEVGQVLHKKLKFSNKLYIHHKIMFVLNS